MRRQATVTLETERLLGGLLPSRKIRARLAVQPEPLYLNELNLNELNEHPAHRVPLPAYEIDRFVSW